MPLPISAYSCAGICFRVQRSGGVVAMCAVEPMATFENGVQVVNLDKRLLILEKVAVE